MEEEEDGDGGSLTGEREKKNGRVRLKHRH